MIFMKETIGGNKQAINRGHIKFVISGILILAAIIYLIVYSTQANAQYYLTVKELAERGSSFVGRNVRVSGAVIGDSIHYNPGKLLLSFDIVHVPGDYREIESQGGLAKVLRDAVTNSNLPRLHVVYNGVKPDLLRHEAQAILTGHLGEDSIFYADELLLKCPTRYEEALPEQSQD